jgi:Zn finger protein HypA/HybF involved in hydrogenase expression
VHEEALLRDLRRKLEEIGRAEGGGPIRQVRIRLGPLAHVTPETLRSRWGDVVGGTPAAAAQLVLESPTDLTSTDASQVELVDVVVDDPPPRPRGIS